MQNEDTSPLISTKSTTKQLSHNPSLSEVRNPPTISRGKRDSHDIYPSGIHEQNIFQIICKPSLITRGESSPYIVEIYKKKLEDKNQEIVLLRQKVTQLQSENKKNTKSSLQNSNQNSHSRAKSQSNYFYLLIKTKQSLHCARTQ